MWRIHNIDYGGFLKIIIAISHELAIEQDKINVFAFFQPEEIAPYKNINDCNIEVQIENRKKRKKYKILILI